VARVVISVGPVFVLLAWFVAGQWSSAGPEPRAWLQFVGVLSIASLMPLPDRSFSLAHFRAQVSRWAWVAVVGLLVTL
jgi:hypothetical protein